MFLYMLFVNCPAVFTDKASVLNLQPHANQSVISDKVLSADRMSHSDMDRNIVFQSLTQKPFTFTMA